MTSSPPPAAEASHPFPLGLLLVGAMLSGWRLSVPADAACGLGPVANTPWELFPLGLILLLATLLALLAKSSRSATAILARTLLYISLCLLVIIHGLDVSISNSFTDRFRLHWLSKFWRDTELIIEIILHSNLVLGLALLTPLAALHLRLPTAVIKLACVASLAMMAVARYSVSETSLECSRRPMVLSLMLAELLEQESSAVRFPDELSLTAAARYQENEPFSGVPDNRSLILLLVESLSAYHSSAVSQLRGVVPEFDALSAQGRLFTNFFANHVDSEGGLVALLSTSPPLEILGGSSFLHREYMHLPSVLPHLKKRGYYTEFLASTPIQFLSKGEYLRAIGFETVNGRDELPRLSSARRFAFASPSDEVLYEELLERVSARLTLGNPFVFVAVTGTSHLPWKDPRERENSEQAVMGYVSEQIGSFVQKLRQTGYLDRGYLLVLGDHRAMTPVTERELTRFGESAIARVPLLLLGPDVTPGIDDRFLQQSDLLPKLAAAIKTSAPLSPTITFVPRIRAAGPPTYRTARVRQLLVFSEADGGRRAGVADLLGTDVRWRVPPPEPLRAEDLTDEIRSRRAAQQHIRFNKVKSCSALGVGGLPTPGQHGVRVTGYTHTGQLRPVQLGPKIFTSTLPQLDQKQLETLIPDHPSNFMLQMSTFLDAPADGRYLFSFLVDDGVCAFIDGQLLVDATFPSSGYHVEAAVELTKGLHEFEVQLYQLGGYANLSTSWILPQPSRSDKWEERLPIPADRFLLPSKH